MAKNRGIQPGTTAGSTQSKKIDNLVNRANKELAIEFGETYPTLRWIPKLTPDLIPGGVGACMPDGGIWLLNGKPFLSSEAKHQGRRGNAISRWYENASILLYYKELMYITFCTGEGVLEGFPIWKTLHRPVEGQFNTIRRKSTNDSAFDNVSVFLTKDGFEYTFIKDTLREVLLSQLSSLDQSSN